MTIKVSDRGLTGGSPLQDDEGVVVVDDKLLVDRAAGGATGMVVKIPERCNLVVESQDSKIEVKGKVEGDVDLSAGKGDVELDKVRGRAVRVDTGGDVYVGTTIEGESLAVSARTLFAKRVMGDAVKLSSCGGVEVGAIYAQEFNLVDRSDTCVKLGAVHGQGKIESASLRIESIDGAISAMCTGQIDVGFDTVPHGQCDLTSATADIAIGLPAPQEHDALFTKIVACAKTVNASESEFEIVDTEEGDEATGRPHKVSLVSTGSAIAGTKPLGVAGVGKINLDQAAKETFSRASKTAPCIVASAPLGSVTLKHVSWVDRIKNKFK